MPDAQVTQARRLPPMNQRARAPQRRPGPAPKPWVVDLLAAAAGLGFGAVMATVIIGESRATLASPGGLLSAAGRFTGLTGTYLIMIMVVLIARLPWLEQSVGQDRLVRWHRWVSPWAIGLIIAHVCLITLGYAQASRTGVMSEIWVLMTSYRDMLAAFVAFGLLLMASVSSYRAVRRKLQYETWWVIHLYLYLAISLAFAHQIYTGIPFIGHPLTRLLWIVLWLATAGMVIMYRVLQPIWRSIRHSLRIVAVREEVPGVVSVVCSGRDLDQLAVSGGQFFMWRFLTRGLWWQAHPYSLSALPRPPYLRVTIKGLGDSSSAVAHLKPGTRVAIEGPYGAFTHHARISDSVLLVGAGVGITPLRALLEDLPVWTDVVVVVRASSPHELVHRDEVAALVKQRGGQLHEIIGPRHKIRLNARTMRRVVPDIAERDVYVCGPEGFSSEIVEAALRLGAAPDQIHHEAFGF